MVNCKYKYLHRNHVVFYNEIDLINERIIIDLNDVNIMFDYSMSLCFFLFFKRFKSSFEYVEI